MKNKHNFYVIDSSQRHLAAEMFQPKRLILARELKGLTKSELASKINKTPSAITQFENGMKPDSKTAMEIAIALGMPISFFTVQSEVKKIISENCHYRSLRSTAVRDRKKLQARGTLIQELVVWLNQFAEWQEEQISSLSTTVRNFDEIEKLTTNIRKTWNLGLGPISNLTMLLENKGVLLTEIPPETKKVDAFSTWSNNLPLIFLASDKGSSSRRRFDIGHEFGHLVMHADVNAGDKELEMQANRFSGAFLFPKDAFVREFPRRINFNVFFDLKKRWNISVGAIIRRAFDLGLISEPTYKRANIEYSRRGYRSGEPNEGQLERPQLLSKVFQATSDHLGLGIPEISEKMGMNAKLLEEVIS